MDAEFRDLSALPSWDRIRVGAISVAAAQDDPEDTLTLALTEREVALFAFSNMIVAYLFPEFQNVISRANIKLMEVSEAQNFLDFEPGEIDEMRGGTDG